MTFEKILLGIVIFLYSIATLGIFLGMLSSKRKLRSWANKVTLAGFATHTLLGITLLINHSLEEITAGYYLLLLPWCFILVWLIAWRILKTQFISLTVAPLALLLSVFSVRLSSIQIVLPDNFAGTFIGLHLGSLFLSIGLLALACGAGSIFLYVNNRIKKKEPLADFATDFPALSTCDKINHVAVMVGFPLYTLGLISGFVWAPLFFQIVANPKILVSLVLWFFYALLFYQRVALGKKGRKPARLAILIFLISVLAIGLDQVFSHHSQILLPLQ